MTLSAVTLLAENTVPLLKRWLVQLNEFGIAIDLVEHTHAADADLVFACGLLTAEMIDQGSPLEVVAAPLFPGESSPVYRSMIICRQDTSFEVLDDLGQVTFARNEEGSWSGWHAWRMHLASAGVEWFGREVETGGHVHSIAAVRSGAAELAAIDSTLWHHLVAGGESFDDLRVLDTTVDWSAPPISLRTPLEPIRRVELLEALLSLPDIEPASVSNYQVMLGHSRS